MSRLVFGDIGYAAQCEAEAREIRLAEARALRAAERARVARAEAQAERVRAAYAASIAS